MYSEFPDMLYNVRYEIAVSEMMESNMSQLEYHIIKEFAHEDTNDNGEITVLQAEIAMKRCKSLNLTPFQIHTLLGLSDCDGDGMIPYKQFAKVCSTYIDENLQFTTLVKKQ
jgi:Ca2+-binding EF-hand superfamily protein